MWLFLRFLGAALVVFALTAGCTSYRGARHYASGNEALEGGDPPGAIAHLERAAELVPQASEVQNHLGIAYQAAGRREEALVAYERAVDLDCDNSAAQHNLLALRHHLGLVANEDARGE